MLILCINNITVNSLTDFIDKCCAQLTAVFSTSWSDCRRPGDEVETWLSHSSFGFSAVVYHISILTAGYLCKMCDYPCK